MTVAVVFIGVVVAGGGDGVSGRCSGGVVQRCFVALWCADEGPGLFNDREEVEHVFWETLFQFSGLLGKHCAFVTVRACVVQAGPA